MNDLDKKKLLIGNPEIITYQFIAYSLAALSVYEESDIWIYNNYIQLYYIPESQEINFLSGDASGCMSCLEYQKMSKNNILDFNLNINETIKFSIDNEYYFYSFVDEYFIPNRSFYKNKHFSHDILIYGYDTDMQYYNIIGFNEKQQFVHTYVSFSQYDDAFKNDSWYNITLFKRNNKAIVLEYQNIKKMLQEYIFSMNSMNSRSMYWDYKSNIYDYICKYNHFEANHVVYGYEIYKYLIEYLNIAINSNKDIDIRIFTLLNEHKKIMLNRLKYLFVNNYIKQDFCNEYEPIYKFTKIILNLAIKYKITNNTNVLERLRTLLVDVKRIEYEIINKLINIM